MPELALVEAITDHLAAAAPGATVGAFEPAAAGDLPALVISLADIQRDGTGVGSRSDLITNGHLQVDITIDLANAVLPAEPDFSLLNPARTLLTLHHGGLVRADGADEDLLAGDVQVRLNGAPRAFNVVDRHVGQLSFPAPLPAAGTLTVRYFLGRWERRVVRLSGQLRVDVLDTDLGSITTLSRAVFDALDPLVARPAIAGLLAIGADDLSSVGPAESAHADARRRQLRFAFHYEHNIDRPESSGGVIQSIPVTTHVRSAS